SNRRYCLSHAAKIALKQKLQWRRGGDRRTSPRMIFISEPCRSFTLRPAKGWLKRSSSLVVLWNWTLGSAWLPLCRVVPHPRRRPHSICLRCPRPDSIPGGAGARPDHPISRCSSCERQDLTGIFFDREKPPPAWDALEDVRTSIRAFHSRSGD